ncbi:MAG TPA: transglutaminase domain-containing protein [Bacteroidia bacterium]|nr:transglutaminase domain-containing protein [Bacteroidia bacterium]
MNGKANTDRRTFLQLLMRWLFILVPTLAASYFVLRAIDLRYTSLDTDLGLQALFFGAGLAVAYSLYFFRVRFLVTFLLIWIAWFVTGKIISNVSGEFDYFLVKTEFDLFSTLFIGGWITGFLLERFKPMRIILPLLFLSAITTILVLTLKSEDATAENILLAIAPFVAYALYMMLAAEQLASMLDADGKKIGYLLLRTTLFLAILLGIVWLSRPDDMKMQMIRKLLQQVESQDNKGNGNNGPYDEKNGLLERGPNGDKQKNGGKDDTNGGGYRLKDTMSMGKKQSQADYLMFCSKLNNYFPDGSPKPLYFVYHYLTKYDPAKESFIRDPEMPYFDEFNVDPSSIPLYRSKTDSTPIKNSFATLMRKDVTAEVYISSNTWSHALLAPGGAYFCETIPVDTSFGKLFTSAYRVKCYASDLNNAYFVYNPSANPALDEIQQQRFAELRNVKSYAGTDSLLYSYYTAMPSGALYDSITALTQRITKDAVTPVDKVIAIRNYFLQKDKNGNRIFRYSLDAGSNSDPNIPNASMLRNFLFKTHVGYCTYYAGASMLMLRSAGIPSRFTTGFATIDRSNKNRGWYWFYASQAHAWTQVFFPGYGWMDFDMTIGNEDQKEAPRPDGTPPLPPPEPWLVAIGKAATAPDLQSKHLGLDFNRIIFFNEDYRLDTTFTREVDASVCRVVYGKKDTTLSAIHPGDSILVVSYDDAAKEVPVPSKTIKIETQVKAFPKPIIADEIHIIPKESAEEKKQEEMKKQEKSAQGTTLAAIFLRLAYIAGGIIVLIMIFPLLWLFGLLFRSAMARDPKEKAYRVYRLALYAYHMAGTYRGEETPLEYAENEIDPVYKNDFAGFMRMYLGLKYSGAAADARTTGITKRFRSGLFASIRKKKGFFPAATAYFYPWRANHYFRRRIDRNEEKPEQP